VSDSLPSTTLSYRLAGTEYRPTAVGSGSASLEIPDLPGLTVSLDRLWLT
jgi:hypothetical protein